MNLELAVPLPDACAGCGLPFGEQEARVATLRRREGTSALVADLLEVVSPEVYHLVPCAPPPGTAGRLVRPEAADEEPEAPVGHRPRLSREHLMMVALVYSRDPVAPVRAVQVQWGVSYATAARWARRARSEGLLPAA